MSGLISGYRKVPLSRVMSAVCHVMCDYCNFKCERCIAWRKNKEMFGEFVDQEMMVVKKKKLLKWKVINGSDKQFEREVSCG